MSETLLTVAALYIDPRGPYPRIDGVECWDESRDARAYDGPLPVVAHPPCGPWGHIRRQYRGSEHDCAPHAVEQVRRYGGVLEHPAGSLLWEAEGLPYPDMGRDMYGGVSIEIDQVEWGHVARKTTWIYVIGPTQLATASVLLGNPPYPGRAPTHWVSGSRNNKRGGSVPPGIKICSAQQRRRTPPLLAEALVEIARGR